MRNVRDKFYIMNDNVYNDKKRLIYKSEREREKKQKHGIKIENHESQINTYKKLLLLIIEYNSFTVADVLFLIFVAPQ